LIFDAMENEGNIRFVARHYRKGRFDAESAWWRLGMVPVQGVWRRFRVAAAVGGAIFLTATAAVLYHAYHPVESPSEVVAPTVESPSEIVEIVDFENAPLPIVIQRIREVYGVEVGNIPADADAYVLSLRYEGTAADLVDTINDILGTQMTVEER